MPSILLADRRNETIGRHALIFADKCKHRAFRRVTSHRALYALSRFDRTDSKGPLLDRGVDNRRTRAPRFKGARIQNVWLSEIPRGLNS